MSAQQKTPLSRTLSTFAIQKALDEIQKRGAPLPGHVVKVSGSIVTVNFDIEGITPPLPQITMPLIGAEYVRLPIQPGDKGVAWPSSVYLGGVSGLGGGTADLTLRGNMAALVWMPLGNSSWSAVNGSKLTLYGPKGATLRDALSKAIIDADATNGVTLSFGSSSVTLGSSALTLSFGGKSIVINATGVTIDGIPWDTHVHPYSGGVTGGPEA